ncbi:MAG: DUF721 domain-containing protein [Acidobacteria bacterium]|nr:DUF721 domain-containing protein [Acidobacteriota bacterium]
MQRTSRLLAKMKLGAARMAPDELAEAVWPAAVGKRLALRTGPVRLFGTRLVVEVEDAVWKNQLTTLGGQILSKVQRITGPGVIEKLEFRIGTPRRPPGIAASMEAADPADGIADPIFRQLYLISRARTEREEAERMRISA